MKNNKEHEYALGFTINTMEACKNSVQPQYKKFRNFVFNAFLNWILEAKLSERALNK